MDGNLLLTKARKLFPDATEDQIQDVVLKCLEADSDDEALMKRAHHASVMRDKRYRQRNLTTGSLQAMDRAVEGDQGLIDLMDGGPKALKCLVRDRGLRAYVKCGTAYLRPL